jgi:hypothetical protein
LTLLAPRLWGAIVSYLRQECNAVLGHSKANKKGEKMKAKWFYVLMCASLMLSLAVMPVLAAPAVDGDGLMSVSPASAVYHSTGNTFVFTFTANNDFPDGAQVRLIIPAGWTTPKSGAGAGHIVVAEGTCALTGSPLFAISGMTIMVDITRCLSGEQFTITYSGVTVPGASSSPYSFTTQTDIPGGDGLFEIFAGSPTVTVDPTTLTISAAGLTPGNKVYDGNTTVPSLTIGSPTLLGVISPDSVSLDTSGATGTFDNRNVGIGKTVTITGLTLTGADAGNYILVDPTRTANITKLSITITAVTDSKTYDGTTSSIGLPILSVATPLASGDVEPVWIQTFSNKNVGIGKIITPAGRVEDGNGGNNYSYVYVPVTTGTISKLPITVEADAKSKAIGTPDPVFTYQVTNGFLAPGDALTLTRISGTTAGIYPIIVNTFPAKNNYTLTYIGANLTITPILNIKSVGVYDGWVLESTSTSSVGGSRNSTSATFNLGDNAAQCQYRAILSFNTINIPDDAIIQSAVIKIKQNGTPVGRNPFDIFGNLLVDISSGTFGTPDLTPTDFEETPAAAIVGIFKKTPINGWYSVTLASTGKEQINKTGITQFRIYFTKENNSNLKADFMKFLSGNSATDRPKLTIKYTLP